jgi:hypothetical protein
MREGEARERRKRRKPPPESIHRSVTDVKDYCIFKYKENSTYMKH